MTARVCAACGNEIRPGQSSGSAGGVVMHLGCWKGSAADPSRWDRDERLLIAVATVAVLLLIAGAFLPLLFH